MFVVCALPDIMFIPARSNGSINFFCLLILCFIYSYLNLCKSRAGRKVAKGLLDRKLDENAYLWIYAVEIFIFVVLIYGYGKGNFFGLAH